MSSTIGKVISCRAALLWKEGEPLTIENITVDPPKCGEVRVRMVSAGLCASDAHCVWGWETDYVFDTNGHPLILGHEGAGIVESVGDGVTSVAVGDKVLMTFMPNCQKCELCRHPISNFCAIDNIFSVLYHANGETRSKIDGKPLLMFVGNGTFAEYSVIREIQLAKVNPETDLKNACIISCAVGTGYGSVTNLAHVHSGSTCAVWGLGAIGLSAVLGCKHLGAQRIIGVDIKSEKENIAKQMGCTEFVNPLTLGKPIEEYLQELGGIDYAFDCVGNQNAIDAALRSLTPSGSLTLIGLGPRGNRVNIAVADVITGRTVNGGFFGRQKSRATIQELVDKYARGELPIEPLITHRIKLDEINEGFDTLKAGKNIRTVIEF